MHPPINFENFKVKPRYACYQLEVGDNGTPHFQGYIVWYRDRRISAMNKDLGNVAWIARRKGKHSEAKTYAIKEDTRVEGPWYFGSDEGIPESQGGRSELFAVKRKIDDGESNLALWNDNFSVMVRAHKALAVYKRLKIQKRSTMPIVFLFVGPPGTGKSELAHILAKSFGSYFKIPSTKGSGLYFDTYDGEVSMIMDEMDGNRCTPTFLNDMLDKYPNSLPVHGSGNVENVSKYIFICSNYLPKFWWRKGHNIQTFWRRVSTFWFSGKRSEPMLAPVQDQFQMISGYNL